MFSSFSFCFASLFAWQLSDAQCFIPFPQARQLRGERARDLVYRTEKEDDQTVALDQTVAACGDCLTSDSYDSQDPKKNQSPARMRLIFRTWWILVEGIQCFQQQSDTAESEAYRICGAYLRYTPRRWLEASWDWDLGCRCDAFRWMTKLTASRYSCSVPREGNVFMHLMHLYAIGYSSSRHAWLHVRRKLRSHHFSHWRSKVPGLDRLKKFGVLYQCFTVWLIFDGIRLLLQLLERSTMLRSLKQSTKSDWKESTFCPRQVNLEAWSFFISQTVELLSCFNLTSFLQFVRVDRWGTSWCSKETWKRLHNARARRAIFPCGVGTNESIDWKQQLCYRCYRLCLTICDYLQLFRTMFWLLRTLRACRSWQLSSSKYLDQRHSVRLVEVVAGRMDL